MAIRKTRLKDRRVSLKSSGTNIQSTRLQPKQNDAVSSARSKSKSTKLSKGGKVIVGVNKLKAKHVKKSPAKQTKRVNGNGSSGTHDEYEFDETDHCNSENSFLSASYLSQSTRKTPKNAPVTKVQPNKKGRSVNPQQSNKVRHKVQSNSKARTVKTKGKVVQKVQNAKKTSTPLLSVSDNSVSQEKQEIDPKLRRSLRVSVLKLDLDLTVTPILPIPTPSFPKQKVRKGYDSQVDSFVAIPKTKSSKAETTPHLPAEKSKQQRTVKPTALAPQSSQLSSVVHGLFKLPVTSASTDFGKKSLKRTRSKSSHGKSSKTESRAKQQKDDQPESKKKKFASKQGDNTSNKSKNLPNKQKKSSNVISKQTSGSDSKASAKKKPRQSKPVTSTPVIPHAELPGVWQPGKEKMYCTPSLHDSGISMGDSSSSTSLTSSTATPSLPGFMEEEPFQSELHDFSSPLPASKPNSSYDPASALNKSSSKEYRPGKTKREKGRHSTSKLDAWASLVNQDLQDVESFELVVE